MTRIETIRNIFSILHDGTIIGWEGNLHLLRLKVGCKYLADRIDPSFDTFFVELVDVARLALVPWMNLGDSQQEYFIGPREIFQAKLDILSAEIEDQFVKVSCSQRDGSLQYCGGTLYLICKDIRLYDQKRFEVTFKTLHQISKEYWDEFGTQ